MKRLRLGPNQIRVLLALTQTPQHRNEVLARVRAQGHTMEMERMEWTLDSLIVRGLAACTDLHTYALGESAELAEMLAFAKEFAALEHTTLAEAEAMLKRATA